MCIGDLLLFVLWMKLKNWFVINGGVLVIFIYCILGVNFYMMRLWFEGFLLLILMVNKKMELLYMSSFL